MKASFIFLHETLQQFCSSPFQAEAEVERDWARARRPGPNSKARRNKALGRQARLAKYFEKLKAGLRLDYLSESLSSNRTGGYFSKARAFPGSTRKSSSLARAQAQKGL